MRKNIKLIPNILFYAVDHNLKQVVTHLMKHATPEHAWLHIYVKLFKDIHRTNVDILVRFSASNLE